MINVEIFNELSEHIALRIHSCLEIEHDKEWMERKIHKDYDIWLITSGCITVETGSSIFTASSGDLVCFYPHIPYLATTDEAGCRFIYIHFEFVLGNHYGILNEYKLAGVIPGRLVSEEAAAFKNAYELYRNHINMSAIRLKGCLIALLAGIIEMHSKEYYIGQFPSGQPSNKRVRGMAALQPIFNLINGQLHRPIRIRELAALAGMAEKYFIVHFKDTLGITPGQYLYQLRMNRAREYLQQKQYSIKEISALLGYPDAYSFSKAFKKYYNIPPSQFA
jgi:AraC family transcriptional regulator